MLLEKDLRAIARTIHREHASIAPPFSLLIAAAEPKGDEDTAKLIDADQHGASMYGMAVTYARYKADLPLQSMPLSRDAAVQAHADSLYELEWAATRDEALKNAKCEAAKCDVEPDIVGHLRPSATRRRAGNKLVLRTPVQLVLMFVFGVGMTAATMYWMGIINTARENQLLADIAAKHERINRLEVEKNLRERVAWEAKARSIIAHYIEVGKSIRDADLDDRPEDDIIALRIVGAIMHDTQITDEELLEQYDMARASVLREVIEYLYPDSVADEVLRILIEREGTDDVSPR